MKITAWTVREQLADALYFAGQDSERRPVFSQLSVRTKQYRSERAANAAINIIVSSGYEGHPVAEYVDGAEVADEQPVPPPNADGDKKYCGYEVLLKYGPIRYLRKSPPDMEPIFAMTDRSGNIRDLGDQELFAFRTFIEELKEVGECNIRNRLIRQGKDPDGLDDWRGG